MQHNEEYLAGEKESQLSLPPPLNQYFNRQQNSLCVWEKHSRFVNYAQVSDNFTQPFHLLRTNHYARNLQRYFNYPFNPPIHLARVVIMEKLLPNYEAQLKFRLFCVMHNPPPSSPQSSYKSSDRKFVVFSFSSLTLSF